MTTPSAAATSASSGFSRETESVQTERFEATGPSFGQESRRLETQKSRWYKLSSKAGRCKTQEDVMFQLESKGRTKPVSQLEGSQAGSIQESFLEAGPAFCSVWIFT